MDRNIRDLIKKYETAGPRYTSYPTAPHFSPDADKKRLAQMAVESDSPVSLYMHIPFCRSKCLFCGCSSTLCSDSKKADEYIALIGNELLLWRENGLQKRKLKQIQLGGGTPNFLSPPQILRLKALLERHFDIDGSDCEFSTELDPRTLDKEQVKAFASIGVNRASIGIQDTNPQIQSAIGRIQPHEKNLQAVQWLRECGIEEINCDLIYGLPLQTPQNFKNTVRDALSLRPTRIALFGYAHVPWIKPAQKVLEKFRIPPPEEKVEMFTEAMEAFEAAGYEYIGLDHFARPEDALIRARKNNTLHRNFQGYTTCAGIDSFAVGLTSISETKISYRQNFKDMGAYAESLKSGMLPIERGIILDGEDILRRGVIMDVMCALKVFFNNYGVDFRSKFEGALAKLEGMRDDGLVDIYPDRFEVTKLGRLFLRNIAMLFDGRLDIGNARYSKTV